ncbi:MAG: CidA/LrgA family protein [Fusobacterium sp.]|uniref:CidA/LrgA family protein n=1 Tax=Fusobacterium sp. TaxID=68766 RepID=UPI0026DAA6C4|nr:CidA/LrgA family protein [Fusobacterium sp.]MDO4690168.1 CidA/LrgA family protein [Fusobacterium sp.]
MAQCMLILIISLLGTTISKYISFPLSETVISSIILFLLLEFKIIKVDFLKNIVAICRKYLSFFFLPVGVGILKELELITMEIFLTVFTITILATFLTMLIVGKVSDIIIYIHTKFFKKKNEEEK